MASSSIYENVSSRTSYLVRELFGRKESSCWITFALLSGFSTIRLLSSKTVLKGRGFETIPHIERDTIEQLEDLPKKKTIPVILRDMKSMLE